MKKNCTTLAYVRTQLHAMQPTTSIAEIHGAVAGVVCAGLHTNGCHWIDSVLGLIVPERSTMAHSRRTLLCLYHLLCEQLSELGNHFHLLLEESDDLATRARSLSDWCHGFLAGLRFAGITDYELYRTNVAEALFHCEEIAKLNHTNIACNDDDIDAFEQVIEYVRLGVILIHSEFTGNHTQQYTNELRYMQPFRPEEAVVH